MDVPATIGGTPDNCRLEEAEDLCNIREEDMESDSAALESRIRWNRLSAAAVLLVDASAAPEDGDDNRSFCSSIIFKNSEMFSPSSSATEPELPPPVAGSVIKPDPGCAEDVVLPLPLLAWSSSVRSVVPPDDNRARRWLKLLLYLVSGVGLGELEVDEAATLSDVNEPALRPAGVGLADGATPSSVKDPNVGTLAECVRGELAKGETPRGDADSVGVLNGCTENELRRLAAAALSEFRVP